MAKIQWTLRDCHKNVFRKLIFIYYQIKLFFLTLFYNEFADKYYIGDTAMEPMFWVVDHFTKFLGPICVTGVITLKASIVAIAYIIGLPFWWRQGVAPTILLLIVGNWILLNVLFNYYMAYITSPGQPPQGALIPEAVSICKKCISPKPPRTHHCSICNVCILKMDHHCPWLNNCIGHFNHRYFFMFCAYVWIGIIFVMIFGLPIAWVHFTTGIEPLNVTFVSQDIDAEEVDIINVMSEPQTNDISTTERKRTWSEALYHSCIVYAALLCIAVFVAVGALLAWHSRLISKGETSIESHINKRERLRLSGEGKIYKNPYDFGRRKNWILFLGIHRGRTWWNIFFPSTHKPEGNGLRWYTESATSNCSETNIKDKLKT